jgi:hypothetical protein
MSERACSRIAGSKDRKMGNSAEPYYEQSWMPATRSKQSAISRSSLVTLEKIEIP